jgi:MSHA biogenesis protein MshK
MMSTLRLAAITVAALAAPAHAQTLPDPTRPPPTLYNAPGSAGAAASAAQPQLQSVLVAQGRKVAVIDGETYRVGDSVKGRRVAAISDTQVVLVQGKQRQVLKLYPVAANNHN